MKNDSNLSKNFRLNFDSGYWQFWLRMLLGHNFCMSVIVKITRMLSHFFENSWTISRLQNWFLTENGGPLSTLSYLLSRWIRENLLSLVNIHPNVSISSKTVNWSPYIRCTFKNYFYSVTKELLNNSDFIGSILNWRVLFDAQIGPTSHYIIFCVIDLAQFSITHM